MSDCERYEILASALADGETEHDESLELVDHLVRCSECRHSWGAVRALDGIVAAAGVGEEHRPPPESAWNRIRSRRIRRPLARAASWALPIAAALALAIGISSVPRGPADPADPDGTIAVQLGEEEESMTDLRFVEVAREILASDDRYRQAMLELMEAVHRSTRSGEGPSEGLADTVEREGSGEEGDRESGRPRV